MSGVSHHETYTWLPLLQRLHQIQNACPRCCTAVQQFMLDYPAEVHATFVSWYTDGKGMSSSQRMNTHYETAKFLLKNQFSHLSGELEQKAAIQHEADMDQWSLIMNDISAAKDVSQYVSLPFTNFINSSLH